MIVQNDLNIKLLLQIERNCYCVPEVEDWPQILDGTVPIFVSLRSQFSKHNRSIIGLAFEIASFCSIVLEGCLEQAQILAILNTGQYYS
jgi:hypothetical protein